LFPTAGKNKSSVKTKWKAKFEVCINEKNAGCTVARRNKKRSYFGNKRIASKVMIEYFS